MKKKTIHSANEKVSKASKKNLTKLWTSDKGEKLKFTFFDSDSYEIFNPIAQCYGLCFNEKGEIAIGKNPHAFGGNWGLPGGRTEKGEIPEQTLKRELLEELDLIVAKFKLLGAQKVDFLDDKNKESVYALRYAVIIKEVNPLTLDPDNGAMWERKFVKPEEVDKYLKWGAILQHLVKKSCEWYELERKKK